MAENKNGSKIASVLESLDGFLERETVQTFTKRATIAIFGFSLSVIGTAYAITNSPELVPKIHKSVVQKVGQIPSPAILIDEAKMMLHKPIEFLENIVKQNTNPRATTQVNTQTNKKVRPSKYNVEKAWKKSKVKGNLIITPIERKVNSPILGKTFIEKGRDGRYDFRTQVGYGSIGDRVSIIIDTDGDGKYSSQEIDAGRDLPIVNGYAVLSDVEIAANNIADVMKNSYVKLKGRAAQSAKGISMFARNYTAKNLSNFESEERITSIPKPEKTYYASIDDNSNFDSELKATLLGKTDNSWLWTDRAEKLNELVNSKNYDRSTISSLYETLQSNKAFKKQLAKGTDSVLQLDRLLRVYA